MRRRVLYDATSRAAAAAADLLRDAFDIAALPTSTPPTGPAVALVGADPVDLPWRGDASLRVLALVDAHATGPWPAHWFALLPADAGGPMLARAVEGAFDDLERTAAMARLERELSELNAIGIRLSAERNPRELIETILTKAREITQSDAGSLYLVEENAAGTRRLRFALAQNDSVSIPYRASRLPLTSASVAGHVALTGETLNLEDAYAPPPGAPFRINRSFDDKARYHTKSMLVVPMRTPQGETIGVLQLINCKPDSAHRFASVSEIERIVRPYSPASRAARRITGLAGGGGHPQQPALRVDPPALRRLRARVRHGDRIARPDHLGPLPPRRESHRGPRRRRRPLRHRRLRRGPLQRRRDDGAPLRRAPARLRQGRRAGAGAGQGQEAPPGRARPASASASS